MELINAFLALTQNLGYGTITLLMTIESSFIPFPSELIIPPAAFLASQGELNIFLVIFYGILGSLIGALINYYLALYLGRIIIYKIADHKILNILLINSKKIKKAEDFFLKYGRTSTFVGRLVPVIRQLISLPAGFAKMNLKLFVFYTGLGSGLWVAVLAFLGYYFGHNQELFLQYYQEISIIFLALAIIVFTVRIYKGKK